MITPEGFESVTAATDIFALGIVLFELLTRRHPFQADSLLAILHAIATEQPVPPSQLNRDISPGLESLILRMLEKDARLRPTAAEVFASLQAMAEPSVAGPPPVAILSSRRAVGREKE